MWKLIVVLALSLPVHALELKRGKSIIHIDDKVEWTLGKDLFGIPFIYFSPQQNGQRSNISFTDTEAEIPINQDDLKATEDIYQSNKRAWADQVGAKALSYLPFTAFKNNKGHKIHLIGFHYEFDKKKYVEKSYYIDCKGRLIFSKSLRLSENESHEKEFEDIVQNLTCGSI